jgi:hypothetical protein
MSDTYSPSVLFWVEAAYNDDTYQNRSSKTLFVGLLWPFFSLFQASHDFLGCSVGCGAWKYVQNRQTELVKNNTFWLMWLYGDLQEVL